MKFVVPTPNVTMEELFGEFVIKARGHQGKNKNKAKAHKDINIKKSKPSSSLKWKETTKGDTL